MSGGTQPARATVEGDFLAAYAERDWPRAVALADRHWTTLVFSPATYEQFFGTLRDAPEDQLLGAPKAALIGEGIGRLPSGTVPVTLPGNAARIAQTLQAGSARDVVELALLAMIARRANGLPRDAVAIARTSRPLVLAAATTRFSPAADLAAYWHLQAGQAALHAADLDQARLDLEQAWTFRGDDVTGYVAYSSAPFLALLAALAGDATDEARWQAEVDRFAAEGRQLIEWETMERPRLVARLIGAADRVDVAAGDRLTTELLPQLSFDETWPFTLFAIVRHLVNAGETARAERVVEEAVEMHGRAPRSGSAHGAFVALARADLALALGRTVLLDRLLTDEDTALVGGLRSLYAIHLELLAGDLPAARRLATIAEHTASDERVRRESRLLGETAPAGPLPPELRRAASLVPAEVNERLRAAYGADVPPSQLATTDLPVARLTPGESRVLEELAAGGSLPDVADRLFISRNTLKSHLRVLYGKLGVSSREEAVAVGGRLGLLGNDEGPPP